MSHDNFVIKQGLGAPHAPEVEMDERRIMVPIVGAIFCLAFLILSWLLAKKEEFNRHLSRVLLALILVQWVFAFFFLISPAWDAGIMLMLSSCVGIYTVFLQDKHWFLLYAILSLWNFLNCIGMNGIFTGGTTLYDSFSVMSCMAYYGGEYGQCYGHINWLHFLALLMIFVTAAQAFVSYILHRSNGQDSGLPSSTSSKYESIGPAQ